MQFVVSLLGIVSICTSLSRALSWIVRLFFPFFRLHPCIKCARRTEPNHSVPFLGQKGAIFSCKIHGRKMLQFQLLWDFEHVYYFVMIFLAKINRSIYWHIWTKIVNSAIPWYSITYYISSHTSSHGDEICTNDTAKHSNTYYYAAWICWKIWELRKTHNMCFGCIWS